MKDKIFSLLGHLPLFSLMSVVGVLPLVFFYGNSDPFELPKVLAVVFFITFFTVLFLIISVFQGAIRITTGPILILLVLLVLWYCLTNFFSVDPGISYSGWLKAFPGSTLGILLVTLLFILITSLLRKVSTIKKVLLSFQFSSLILSIIGIFSAFNIYLLPTVGFKGAFWTPGGTSAALTGVIVVLGVLTSFGLLFQTLTKNRTLWLGYLAASIITMFTYLTLLNIPTLWLLLIVGLVSFLVMARKFENSTIFISLVLLIICLAVITLRLLLLGGLRVPTQINLPTGTAWEVTGQTINHYPQGSGPGTFGYDFRLFKPADLNKTNLFNINFETSGIGILDLVTEIGLPGAGLYLLIFLITLFLLARFYRACNKTDPVRILVALLFSLVVVCLLITFLLPTNLLLFFFIFLLLSLVASLIRVGLPQYFRDFRFKMSETGWLIVIITTAFLIFNFNLVFKIYQSDLLVSQSTKLQNSSPETSYQKLLDSVRLNKNADFLHRQFSLTNLALANSVAQNQTTPQEKRLQTVSTLVKQALNEARAATTVNPKDSRNWKLYGTVLLQISKSIGTTDTDIKDKFNRALALEPTDPEIYLNLGNIAAIAKDYPGALSFYTQGLLLKDNYYPLRIQLAENYLLEAENSPNKKALFAQAVEEFKKALAEMEINNPERDIVIKKLGQVEEASRKDQ